jgi:hypothetical protein
MSFLCDCCDQEIDGSAAERNFGRGTCTACIEWLWSPEYQAAMQRGYEQWQAERAAIVEQRRQRALEMTKKG